MSDSCSQPYGAVPSRKLYHTSVKSFLLYNSLSSSFYNNISQVPITIFETLSGFDTTIILGLIHMLKAAGIPFFHKNHIVERPDRQYPRKIHRNQIRKCTCLPYFYKKQVRTSLEKLHRELFAADSPMTSVSRWSPNIHGSWISLHSKALALEDIHRLSCNVGIRNLLRKASQSSTLLHYASTGKYLTCQPTLRIFALPVSLEDGPSTSYPDDDSGMDEIGADDSSKKVLPQKLANEELMSLLADSGRSKLIRKLSEANQHNRFLKRQLQIKEDALLNFKSELAVMEFEIQTLVTLAEEIAKSGIQPGARKIQGKYIHSHLISRLQAVHKKLKEQIKDVALVQSKEVRLLWHGMAENVLVMGTFDGWSQGENLSPEYSGSYTQFSTTLMLRPGRYEIKFLVDGEWRLSPELPTIGEGMLENNLLIVE